MRSTDWAFLVEPLFYGAGTGCIGFVLFLRLLRLSDELLLFSSYFSSSGDFVSSCIFIAAMFCIDMDMMA
jgi:hypothetical protein